ncbi:hypothetical protein BQ8794_320042 [Mesorhizobium prunaredense]|uniref:Uncharacterized protein n=1 Tax=Mesorhizobium prunaredense TaxID=1631249 RepID=A0A1R3VBD5_9HYPH|nr:hypothetical protein BQ8794_320042 [Mesorhizobium prunaredense]
MEASGAGDRQSDQGKRCQIPQGGLVAKISSGGKNGRFLAGLKLRKHFGYRWQACDLGYEDKCGPIGAVTT